jgi:anti-sigma regulatory factor (Ser/Thr protein kinase)
MLTGTAGGFAAGDSVLWGVGTTMATEPIELPNQEIEATPDLHLTLPARAENVAVVRHAFGGLGDAMPVTEQTLSDIKLAVTEACTNVVVHAYEDGEEGPLDVAATLVDARLIVVVRDRGRGIVPRPDSPGLGLGLPLIATLAESLELGTSADDETEVRMTFRLDEPRVRRAGLR